MTWYTGSNNINSPVHGLLEHATILGIIIYAEGRVLRLKTPLGAVIELCTPHESHFKACIRESCSHLIFTQLANRLAHEDEVAAASLAAARKNTNLKHIQ